MVFVGANFEMSCNGPNTTSGTPISIKWSIISDFNSSSLIFVCPSETRGRCEDIDGHRLDVQNSYNSLFTMENVLLDDATKYQCKIRTLSDETLCKFNVTIKELLGSLTLINENEGTSINCSFLKVRADVKATITCRANTSVYLQWYPNCSDLSYHACHESDPHNGSRALTFTPRPSKNGTILTCRIENIDVVLITLKVEVCVQHLEIVRNGSLESTVGGQSALTCQTNTSYFNLTSSSLFFNTSHLDGAGNENTTASRENASYKPDSNVKFLSCCVSKTSLCPGVCSKEYFNVLHGSIYLASTDHREIITVANTDGFPGRVPGELDNDHVPAAHTTGHDRGALPPIPTITADPSIHDSPVPSQVAQTNRRMAQRSLDRIPLQSLESPVDDTLERGQTRTMGARSNACTRVKTKLRGVVVHPQLPLRKEMERKGNMLHVYTASASGLAEYAVVDTTREERKKGQSRAHQRDMTYHDQELDYAVIDKTKKSRREK